MDQLVKLNGKLFVSTRSGRYGDFNIAKLQTPIGDFVVKDKWMEQLEAGAYAGAFVIGRIFAQTIQLQSGALLTELRARVDDYVLLDDGDVPETVEIGAKEQDPIVEETSETPDLVEAPKEADDTDAPVKDPVDEDEANALLFGELWPLAQTVALDPATDRTQFRKQKDHLKTLGYKYQPDRKVWLLTKE